VLENRVLRRKSGPEREEMAGGCRRLHDEELHNLYSSPDIIRVVKSRRMRWVGREARMAEMRKSTKFWLENLKGRENSSRIWEDNIKMDLKEIRWEDVDWMHVDQDRDRWRILVNTVMKLRVLQKTQNFLTRPKSRGSSAGLLWLSLIPPQT